jgi:hypothetical protein
MRVVFAKKGTMASIVRSLACAHHQALNLATARLAHARVLQVGQASFVMSVMLTTFLLALVMFIAHVKRHAWVVAIAMRQGLVYAMLVGVLLVVAMDAHPITIRYGRWLRTSGPIALVT